MDVTFSIVGFLGGTTYVLILKNHGSTINVRK